MRSEAHHRYRCAIPTMLLLAGFGSGAEPQEPQTFRIAVNVNLVVVNATVRDRKGGFVSDVREKDFEVYEDGIRQSITLFQHEDIPVTVGLVVDHSGSMHLKLPEVVAAVRTFARASNPEDQMFVVDFNEHVTEGLPAGVPFTNRPEELEAAILNVRSAGQTALYDAVAMALGRLQSGGRDKKVLIVVSDGGDNASVKTEAAVLKLANQSSALVYTIGIFEEQDPDKNPAVLRRLAKATGGEAFFPEQLPDVVTICGNIAREIRHQYTIGYVSAKGVHPGVYESIRVVAHGPEGKLVVRARAGYIASAK
jgi:Ca-activated chloride channel homolog